MKAAERATFGAIVGGLLVAASVGFLVFRSLFVALPQSYDALLYGRSLSGVATGNPFNPVYGTHWLGIHANLILFALAPLARVVEPVAVLAGASALSIGATAALVAGELGRRSSSHGMAAGLAWALVVGLGTPLLTNPFMFDARPEAIAVPLLTAALLRARARQRFDAAAIALLAAAATVREEFAVVAAAALLVAPVAWQTRRDTLVRLAVAALLAGWALLYVAFVRPSLDAGFAGDRAAMAAGDLFGLGGAATWRYRATLIASLALTGGGLVLRGFRWLPVAGLGLAFCLAIDKHPDQAMRFHYLMLVVPGVLVALVDGFARAAGHSSRRLALAAAVGIVLTWHHGALPFARTWDDTFFAIDDQGDLPAIADARDVVAALPADAGVAVPYVLASSEADRQTIYSMESLRHAIRQSDHLPDGVEFVVLLAADFESLGRLLVHQHGMRLVVYRPGQLAVLTTRPIAAWTSLPGLSCDGRLLVPSTRWDTLGLFVSYVSGQTLLVREREVASMPDLLPARVSGGTLLVHPPLAGLIRLSDIPIGCSALLDSTETDGWVLVDAAGGVFEPTRPSGP